MRQTHKAKRSRRDPLKGVRVGITGVLRQVLGHHWTKFVKKFTNPNAVIVRPLCELHETVLKRLHTALEDLAAKCRVRYCREHGVFSPR